MVSGSYTPAEATEIWIKSGVARHRASILQNLVKGFYGGALLSMGGIVALIIGGGEIALTATYPGLNKLFVVIHLICITAAVFPIGLMMIVITGTGDLVTSNMAIMLMAAWRRRIPAWSYPMNVAVVFFGNLFGSLFVAGIFGYYSGIFEGSFRTWAVTFAAAKAVAPTWANILVRGMACNFLVCIAVFQATMSCDIVSKIIAIELPIFLFVACGYDHVVANMLFIPLALMLQAPAPLTVGLYIYKSMIASFIGNVFGAAMISFPLLYFHCISEEQDVEAGIITESSGHSEKPSMFKKMTGSARVVESE